MKFLIDISPAKMASRTSELIAGQLLTPLTRYANFGGSFAIDNGAFSKFYEDSFRSLLRRNLPHVTQCLFVACPDIVGSHSRTIELWQHRHTWITPEWPIAFVAQDGAENGCIPWDDMAAVFIGGGDPWKDSKAVLDIVKTAKILGKHVHVGRVNTFKRYRLFADAGADTCDGSGIAMYDHMLGNIERDVDAESRQYRLEFASSPSGEGE